MSMRNVRRVFSALLIAVMLSAVLAPAALASVSAKVSYGKAKVYKSPSTKSASVSVAKNLTVNITAISGKWAKVKRNGVTAYIPLKWLTPANKVPAYVKSTTTTYNSSFRSMGKVAKGKSVYALGTIGSYYLVMNPSNGKLAYVPSGTLSQTKPSGSSSSSSSSKAKVNSSSISKSTTKKPKVAEEGTASDTIEKMLKYADGLVGTVYSKIDCSTFVYKCLTKVNLPAKDTAAKQAAHSYYDKITDMSDLQRGDILCFDTSGDKSVDHTAFYLGSGWFIESSRIAGMVHYNYMTEFYQQAFMWARRIDE